MSSVQEIEDAIAALSPLEMNQIHSWLDEQIASHVDAALERDVNAGVFDDAIDRALAEEKAGKIRSLQSR